jgi:hypothetical protein
MKIAVSRAYCYNYKLRFGNGIEIDKKDISKRCYDIFKYCQIPIGYEIQNLDDEPLEVIYPEYSIKGKLYIGEEKVKELQPKEFIILPTRYILLLLFKNNKLHKLEIENGTFEKIKSNLKSKDSNIELSNYYFKPSKLFLLKSGLVDEEESPKLMYSSNNFNPWKNYYDEDYFPVVAFHRPIGYMEVHTVLEAKNTGKNEFRYEKRQIEEDKWVQLRLKDKIFNKDLTNYLHIVEPEMLKIFGNSENYAITKNKEVKNIQIKSSIRFISFIKRNIYGIYNQ